MNDYQLTARWNIAKLKSIGNCILACENKQINTILNKRTWFQKAEKKHTDFGVLSLGVAPAGIEPTSKV